MSFAGGPFELTGEGPVRHTCATEVDGSECAACGACSGKVAPPTKRDAARLATVTMGEIHRAIVATGRALLWRNNAGVATYGAARVRYGLGLGSPDLVGVLVGSGRGFALEVKTGSGRLSPEQRAWHRAWSRAGAYVACVHSADEALAALEIASVAIGGES